MKLTVLEYIFQSYNKRKRSKHSIDKSRVNPFLFPKEKTPKQRERTRRMSSKQVAKGNQSMGKINSDKKIKESNKVQNAKQSVHLSPVNFKVFNLKRQ